MQLTSKTPGLDEKLDGLLSLLMHEFEDQPAIPLDGFYDRYGEFFGEELHNLQEILFEDGLVRCFVGPDGLELEITHKGIDFMAKGGYSSEIREEMISHDDALRAQKNNRLWNILITIGFVAAIAICFYLRHRPTDLSFMQPDYPKKLFPDQRENFVFLLEMLAILFRIEACRSSVTYLGIYFNPGFLHPET